MYVEGIGEVTLVSRETVNVAKEEYRKNKVYNSKRYLVAEQWTKLPITKMREKLDLIIRQEVGITYGQMMDEARRLYGQGGVREIGDLVELSHLECVGFGLWMVKNKMELRRKYPSMVVKVNRTKEDEVLRRHAKYITNNSKS